MNVPLALQVYGGVVYMDFNQEHMQAHGCGLYQSLRPQQLPRLWLIYCDNPSDSGKVHSTVKQRWLAGDRAVVEGMQQVAQCAEQGRWVGGFEDLGTLRHGVVGGDGTASSCGWRRSLPWWKACGRWHSVLNNAGGRWALAAVGSQL
jgi:hypothetical protein